MTPSRGQTPSSEEAAAETGLALSIAGSGGLFSAALGRATRKTILQAMQDRGFDWSQLAAWRKGNRQRPIAFTGAWFGRPCEHRFRFEPDGSLRTLTAKFDLHADADDTAVFNAVVATAVAELGEWSTTASLDEGGQRLVGFGWYEQGFTVVVQGRLTSPQTLGVAVEFSRWPRS